MPVERTIKLEADVKDALKKIDKLTESVDDLGKSQKKTESNTKKMGGSFKAMGIAKITAGVQLLTSFFNKLWEQMQRNEQVADTVQTVFNSIGVAFKLVTDALINVKDRIAESTQNFDALGRVITNLLNIAITPLKLAFRGIQLGIQTAMLAWEESFLGGKGKDIERIAALKLEIDATKDAIKEVGLAAWESGQNIVQDFGEAVGEIVNISNVVVDEFQKTFEGVTVASIIEQGKAITETRKNYELLALQQQRLVEQYDIEAESQRAIRDDISRSIDERIAANEELGRVLKEQNEVEQKAIDAQIASLQQRIDLEGESTQLSNEIFALETEKVAIQAKVKGFEAEQLTNINSLLKEKEDLQKIALQRSNLEQEALKLGLEFQKNISDEELKLLIDTENKKQEVLKQRIEADKQMRIGAAMEIFNSLHAIRETELNQEKENLNKQLEDGLITQEQYDKKLEKIEKQAEERQKKQALIQILVSTAQGISKAIAAGAGIPFPANLGAILSGVAAVIGGMAGAKSALASAGGGSADTPSPDIGSADAGGMGALIPNVENIEQPTLGGTDQASIQAYVIENDISNAQALQQELDTQATL